VDYRKLTQRVRQHHAIEHATLTLLSQRQPDTQAVARSDAQGFMVYGDVETSALQRVAQEALTRLQAGETKLAVHANCGTNLVTAGALSGLAALLVGAGRNRSFWERLPGAVLGATAALVLAGPAGLWMQANVTTTPRVDGLRIDSVSRMDGGPVIRHRVRIGD
jgi:hypothetical protein